MHRQYDCLQNLHGQEQSGGRDIAFEMAEQKDSFSLEQLLAEVPPENYMIESSENKAKMWGRFGDEWRLEKKSWGGYHIKHKHQS